MTGELIAFMGLALVGIIGGVLLLNLRGVVQAVLALVLTFISIAGIYILLSAEFIAGVQILIYSGAITIIMMFGIMLTRHDDVEEPKTGRLRKFFVFLGVVGFAAAVYFGIYNLELPASELALHENNTKQIGEAIYTKFVIPFEVTSVVLLVALIGAIVLAKKDDEKEAEK
ncbi:MAG: NADH-quinone oxidoreductase subunit J [Bacillus sp. (in: firmicutes)]|uniref:NADH-quinone oxidoreductase subunit J n=1 Tax=Bacillus marasmi TaxID=1926279 RepID=UPI0011CAE735|nr:NADH-quinone oxidoreductase subunit J [Bacillus marasmi]